MASTDDKQPFRDPTSEFYDSLAEYYDALRDIIGPPAPRFYPDLITQRTRSILDLGCGTGIITGTLADRLMEQHGSLAGVRVVGVDASAKMLRIARARDNRIEWIEGDMREPPVEGTFDLVVCCYHTLQYMLTEQDVARVFNAVRAHLQPNGLFAFDIYQPNFEYLKSPRNDKLIRSTVDAEGRTVELREDASYDAATRVLRLDWRLVRKETQGPVILAGARQHVGQYTAVDIDRLLIGSGLRTSERFGDTDRSPFRPTSKEQVVICRPSS